MKKIIFVGGYQGSGKSTSLEYIEKKGFCCYSTSRILHKISDKFLNIFTKYDPIYKDKDYKRTVNICIAEEILKPILGQDIFANALVNQVVEDNNKNICIETNGGLEFFLISSLLSRSPEFCLSESININMRSQNEGVGKDFRKLLSPATDLWFEDDWTVKAALLDKIIGDFLIV
jgi:hypothetical protein